MKRARLPKFKAPSTARSATMRAVKGANTAPELRVRKLIRALGHRVSLNCRDLPGAPDIVIARLKATVLVHGCFWHGHDCARGARVPKTNRAYWTAKIARNRTRDRTALKQLKTLGWRPLIIWECALKDDARLTRRLSRFLTLAQQGPRAAPRAR